jgi:hypothetical protein
MGVGPSHKRRSLGWLSLLLVAVPAWALFSSPKSELWEHWARHDETASATIRHDAWAKFLSAYVEISADGINRVRYAQVTNVDRELLGGYIDALTGLAISTYNRAEQRAYWINLYNALTLKVVLDRYPVGSIRDIDISPGLFSIGPWGKKLITVEAQELSLNDIEHRILRPIWNDPRIHYAVNCASIGCPNLMPLAFTAENSEMLLEQGARDYINHPRGVEIVDGQLVASKIYDWFRPDFGDSDQAVLAHLRRYAGPELDRKLAGFRRPGLYRYDWTLNAAAAD